MLGSFLFVSGHIILVLMLLLVFTQKEAEKRWNSQLQGQQHTQCKKTEIKGLRNKQWTYFSDEEWKFTGISTDLSSINYETHILENLREYLISVICQFMYNYGFVPHLVVFFHYIEFTS